MRRFSVAPLIIALACLFFGCERDSGRQATNTAGTSGGTQTAAGGTPPQQQGGRGGQGQMPNTTRSVIINGTRLGDQDVAALERAYRVRVTDGDYWYDSMTGAWGRRGGPVEAFVMPGLNLGGPLQANASNGDTGVFVNGRELHRIDVMRLQQIGVPVQQGRFLMDSYGNVAYENGAYIGNILQAAGASNAPKEGILSTWDKTGVAVIGGDVLIR
jgi:hypothetical protein